MRASLLGFTCAMLVCAPLVRGAGVTNIILCIGDGMGPEQIHAGRCYLGANLVFESWPVHGSVKTFSANSAITDSAAAGTAMACGRKVNNGVLSLALPGNGQAYETFLEFCARKGKRTGLVTTTSMNDATPGAFGAHVTNRGQTSAIVSNYLNLSRPDVMLGGGDTVITVTGALDSGYVVVTSRTELLAVDADVALPLWGQFGNTSLPYEYDGLGELPHLSEMTAAALRVLESHDGGFFLMVEGGRIDHAGHINDIDRCVREVAEFDSAVRMIFTWASSRTDTLILLTADHETGGLSVVADQGPGEAPVVTWSTTGHTATDVDIFAWGPGSAAIPSVIDNTEIYRIMMRALDMPPAGVSISVAANAVQTLWDGRIGATSRLERSDANLGSSWVTIASTAAPTHVVSLVDTNAAGVGMQFYRLQSTP